MVADRYVFREPAAVGQAEAAPAKNSVPSTAEPSGLADTEPLPNSVAVIPFTNLSPRQERGYCAAGVHDEILNQLRELQNLNVIARTSALQYAGTNKTIQEVGRELNLSCERRRTLVDEDFGKGQLDLMACADRHDVLRGRTTERTGESGGDNERDRVVRRVLAACGDWRGSRAAREARNARHSRAPAGTRRRGHADGLPRCASADAELAVLISWPSPTLALSRCEQRAGSQFKARARPRATRENAVAAKPLLSVLSSV